MHGTDYCCNHHRYPTLFLLKFFEAGMVVRLVKDPDNPYNEEAIQAVIPPSGKIGYVANSTSTVPKGCRSTCRIYGSLEQQVYGVIRFIVKDLVIIELLEGTTVFDMLLQENQSFPFK